MPAFAIGRLFEVSARIEVHFAEVVLHRSILGLRQAGVIVEISTPIYHSLKAKKEQVIAHMFFSSIMNSLLIAAVAGTVFFLVFYNEIVPLVVPERSTA
ncbi:hypothetical protein N9H09_00255 [bacterium]|nr:hypothetical protein [bacterium]